VALNAQLLRRLDLTPKTSTEKILDRESSIERASEHTTTTSELTQQEQTR